jgi:hypothetical protein
MVLERSRPLEGLLAMDCGAGRGARRHSSDDFHPPKRTNSQCEACFITVLESRYALNP